MNNRRSQLLNNISVRKGVSSALIFGGVLLFQPVSGLAQEKEVYSGVELGLGAHFTDYDADEALTTAEGPLFQLGYRFDNPFSVELLHTEADHDPRGTLTNEVETSHSLLNVLYHYNTGAKAEPYVGIGAGRYDTDSGTVSNEETSFNMSVGLKYHFSKYFTLRPEIGYRNISGDIDEDFFDVNIILTAVLGGGGTKASVPKTETAPIAEPAPIVEPEPVDSDKDGVVDSEDQCPDTPMGEAVDEQGCTLPKDADGDGVLDVDDQCPDTPKGETVDASGCKVPPKDTDGDGVFDDVDKCPDTAQKLKVDEAGCPKRLTETVSIRLDIKFDSNSAEIKPDHYTEIQKIATFLEQYAGTVVQIEGHTDTLGKASYNKSLSQKRADAVAKVLVESLGVDSTRVTTMGFGEEQPIADDATAEGRETNRRVVGEISVDTERFENR